MTTTPEELLSQARDALKPCPHCGLLHTLKLTTAQELAEEGEDDPDPWVHSDSWAVICDMSRPYGPGGCGASGGFYPSEAEAIEAWNRRAAIDAHLKQPSAPSGEPAAPTRADLIAALRFYATGGHFNLSDKSAWDTVSGEPQNWWCDEAGTATIEDGSLAKMALAGDMTAEHFAALERGDDVCVEAAPDRAAPQAAPAPQAAVQPLTDERWLKLRTAKTGRRLRRQHDEREKAELLELVRFAESACAAAWGVTLAATTAKG